MTITDLGGIGKTQLALRYAYDYREAFHAIFWINAGSQTKLSEGFSAISRCVSSRSLAEHHYGHTIDICKTLHWLSTTKKSWLLVFDNADDPRDLSQC